MSQLDDKIVNFQDDMTKVATFVNGSETADVQTAAGPIPTLAKIAKSSRDLIASLATGLTSLLRVDVVQTFTDDQKHTAKANLGLENVDNTADLDKPVSRPTAQAIAALNGTIAAKEDPINKNKANGYPGLNSFRIMVRNISDTFTSYLVSNTTDSRTWTYPDKSGTVALLSDITGENSGRNTGDETQASILAKLQISSISGVNTGDETKQSLTTKLNVTSAEDSANRVTTLTQPNDTTYPTTNAVKQYVDNISSGILRDCGNYDASVGSWPSSGGTGTNGAIQKGNFWYVSTAGSIAGVTVSVGDQIRAVADTPGQVNANWAVLHTNSVQTITLTGDVLGSGSGSFATTIAPNSVTVAKLGQINTASFLGRYSAGTGNVEILSIGQMRNLLNVDQVNNTADTDKPISNATQIALNLREMLSNKASDFTVIDNNRYPTTQAVKSFMDTRLTSVVFDCGNLDASSNVFPTTGGTGANGAIAKGNLFFISVAGTLGGVAVNVGDSVRALTNTPGQDATKWDVLESNIGYVPYNASNPAGYISTVTASMIATALGYTPINPAVKNAFDGLVGMTGYKIVLNNTAGSIYSLLQNSNTASRTYTLPDKDGTIALISDVQAMSAGQSGGSETQATILQKLGISSISGNNTGDETQATILGKLGATSVTGSNTGDQTITLTGDVVGSGTGSFAATIQPNTVTLAKMAQLTAGLFLGRATNGTGNVEAMNAATARNLLGIDQINNTSDANKPISNATQGALNLKEDSANKATDFTTINNTKYPSVQAVKAYVDGRLVSIMVDCGSWDASGNAYPTTGGSGTSGAILKGNLFFISVAGTLGGVAVKVGDSMRALTDNPGQTAGNWDILETNIGYVPYNATNPAGYISGITSSMVTTALGYTPISSAKLMASNGVAGLINYNLALYNTGGTVVSQLTNGATAARTYTLPDKSGTLAMVNDITGTNSGTNTGDETTATIVAKIGYTPVNKTGDTLSGALNYAPTVQIASAANVNLSTATSNVVEITGTTQITSFTLSDGFMRMVRFAGALTLKNSANLVLPTNADIATQAGDWSIVVQKGTAVYVMAYFPASGLAVFGNSRDKSRSITVGSSSTSIDLNNGDAASVIKASITANSTVTFTNPPPSPNGEVFSFSFVTTNDANGPWAISFGNTIKWAGGNLPPRTTTANAIDVWSFIYDNGTYYGSLAIQDAK